MSEACPLNEQAARDLLAQAAESLGMRLEDGELYTLRRGVLKHLTRSDDDSALRKIRIMPEAYEASQRIARQLRARMRGYRPDPALVASALIMYASEHPEVTAIVQQYLQALFSPPPSASRVDAARGG